MIGDLNGVEFVLLHDGQRVSGGEICFIRQDVSVQVDDPALTFFAGRDVRCLSADHVIEFPVGRFRFYARSGRLIGITRGIVVRSPNSDGTTYRAVPEGPPAMSRPDADGFPKIARDQEATFQDQADGRLRPGVHLALLVRAGGFLRHVCV